VIKDFRKVIVTSQLYLIEENLIRCNYWRLIENKYLYIYIYEGMMRGTNLDLRTNI
jgi:hypothetical protein